MDDIGGWGGGAEVITLIQHRQKKYIFSSEVEDLLFILFFQKNNFCRIHLAEHLHAELCQSNGFLHRLPLSRCPCNNWSCQVLYTKLDVFPWPQNAQGVCFFFFPKVASQWN